MNISTVNELIQSLESAGMNNEIERIAQHNDMSVEFVTWFFNEKKSACGEHWFLVLGAMWEGWKGRSIEMDRLAAENVALKAAFDKPQAYLSWHAIPPTWDEPLPCGEYLDVHDTDGHKNSDGTDCWPVYAKPEIETPTTDRIVAGIKADGVDSGIETIMTMLNHQAPGVSDAINVLRVHSSELREGAEK